MCRSRSAILCVRSTVLEPLLARQGENIAFSWDLPDDARDTTLAIALNKPYNSLFFASTYRFETGMVFQTTRAYEGRVNVTGLVQFTLLNVTSQDAGKYICLTGFMENDILPDCGQSLFLIEAPRGITATARSSPVAGSPCTLQCNGTSVTSPRDHELPMTYRWFERDTKTGAWRDFPARAAGDQEQNYTAMQKQNMFDTGSGEVNLSDWPSGVLTLETIGRKDEGRKFACQASEGLGLWSAMSAPYTLEPEWGPMTSDLSLSPPADSVSLTVGQSASSTCSASCHPACTVIWQKVLDKNQTSTVTTDSTLTFASVERHDEATYRCVASNRHGTSFTSWSLAVQDAPKSWISDRTHIIIVVAVSTLILAGGMALTALIVLRCRRRSVPFMLPRGSDSVALSYIENNSNSSHC